MIKSKLPFTLDYVTKRLATDIVTIKRFSSGIINESYLLKFKNKKQLVIRIYNTERKLKDVMREIKIMEQLQKKGIPIPKIYNIKNKKFLHFKDENKKKRVAICMEFIDGSELKSNDYNLIEVCACTQAKMHGLLSNNKMSFKNKQRGILKIKKWMDKEVFDILHNENIKDNMKNEIFKRYKNILKEWKENKKVLTTLPFGIVHFDYDSSNILIKNGNIAGIIDFDDITQAPLIVDLGFSLWWWLFFNFKKNSLKVGKDYIRAYSQTRKLTKEEEDLLFLVIRVRNMILLCLLFVNHSSKIQENKIKQALSLDTLLINNSIN